MSKFVLSARLALLPPTNVRQVYTSISNQLSNITSTVTLVGPNNVPQIVNRINSQLRGVNRNINVNINAKSNLRTVGANIRSLTQMTNQAASSMEALGAQASKTVRKYGAFTIATTGFIKLSQAIGSGIDEAIAYDRELVRISQVTGTSLAGLNGLSKEVTRLSTTFGVSSEKILESAVTLSQAGLSAKDTKIALEALAKTGLSATFGDIGQTGEAAIAIMQQFSYTTKDLTSIMSSINAVSAQFAVESEDITVAVKRAGGALEAAGVNFHEFQALLTSVRQTTRESAESIATGFRTIFARLQRVRTQNFLKDLGIDVLNDKGLFVGGYEAIGRISKALKGLQGTDPRFAQIIEELGGFRQVSKVIPLIEQFDVAQKALNVSMRGGDSLTKDAEVAQQSLAVQINKTKESFLAFVRGIAEDETFKQTVKSVLSLANAFIEVAKAVKPLYPMIIALGGLKLAQSLGPFSKGFKKDFLGFNTGGFVPGTGDSDNVPAMLTPGEFVIKKSAARSIGYSNLHRMNKYAEGGVVGLNKKKLGKRFNGNPEFAAEREAKYVEGVKTYDFGYATLSPVGKLYDYNFPVNDKSFTDIRGNSQANIHVRGMTEQVSDSITSSFQKSIADAIYNKATEFSFVGTPIKLDPNQIPNMSSAVGGMFEGMIKSLKGNVSNIGKGNKNLDFIGGLGGVSKLFVGSEALQNNPTDAKAAFNDTQRASMIAKAVSFIADSQNKKKAKTQSIAIGIEQHVSGKPIYDRFLETATAVTDNSEYRGKNIKRPDIQKAIMQKLGIGIDEFNDLWSQLKSQDGAGVFKVGHKGITRRNTGGPIPGQGDSDTVPALLTPGEFVINKTSAKAIGYGNLSRLNRYSGGGVALRRDDEDEIDTKPGYISNEGIYYAYLDSNILSAKGISLDNPRSVGKRITYPDFITANKFRPEETGPLNSSLMSMYLKAGQTSVGQSQIGNDFPSFKLPTYSTFKIIGRDKNALHSVRLDPVDRKSFKKNSYASRNNVEGVFTHRIYPHTPDESVSLTNYTGEGYEDVNAYLRKGKRSGAKLEDVKDRIVDIDGTVAKNVLISDITLYRGYGSSGRKAIERQIGTGIYDRDARGKIFIERGFVSTSTSPQITHGFGDNLMSIRAKAGQHAVPAPTFSNEKEIILPRKSAFEIMGGSKYDGLRVRLANPIVDYGLIDGLSKEGAIRQRVPKKIIRRNTGGPIDGQGDSDTIPALLTPGEFVINKKAAKRIGYSTLNHMNRSGKSIRKLNSGGPPSAYPIFQGDPHTNLSQTTSVKRGDRYNGPDPATIGIGLFALSEVLDKAFGDNSSLSKLTKAALSLYGAFTVYAAVFKQSGKAFNNSKSLYKYTSLGRANANITTDSVANSDPTFVAKIRAKKDAIRSNARQNLKTVRASEETELEAQDRFAAIAKSDRTARSATNTFRRRTDPTSTSYNAVTRSNFIDKINTDNIPAQIGTETEQLRQQEAERRARRNVQAQVRSAARRGQTYTVQEIAQRTAASTQTALTNINTDNTIFGNTDLANTYNQYSYDRNIGRNMTGVITGTKKRKKQAKRNVANSGWPKAIFDARDEELASVVPDMNGELEQRVKNLRRVNFLKQKRLVSRTAKGGAVVATIGSAAGDYFRSKGEEGLNNPNISDYSSAKSNYTLGSALSGGAAGAAAGMQAGAALGPYGVLAGAVIGGAAGGGYAWVKAAEEADKIMRGVKLDKQLEGLGRVFQQLSKDMMTLDSVKGNVLGTISTQFESISQLSGTERSDSIAKVKNQSTDIENFYLDIAKGSKSMAEFDKKTNGSLAKFAAISGINFDELTKTVKATIDAEIKAKAAIDKLTAASAKQASLADILDSFTSSLTLASIALEGFDKTLDRIDAGIDFKGTSFKSSDISTIFKTASSGRFADNQRTSTISSNLLSPFGLAGQEMSTRVNDINKAKALLPQLITNFAQTPLTGSDITPQDVVSEGLKNAGISQEIIGQVTAGITSTIGEGGKPSRLTEKFNANQSDTVNDIFKVLNPFNDAIAEFATKISDHNDKIGRIFEVSAKIQSKIVDYEVQKFENAVDITGKLRDNAGLPPNSAAGKAFDTTKNQLISGSNNVDISFLRDVAIAAKGSVAQMDEEIKTRSELGLDVTNEIAIRQENITKLQDSTKALDNMTKAGYEFAELEKELADAGEERRFRRNNITNQAFGSDKDKLNEAKVMAAVTGLALGRIKIGDVKNDTSKQDILKFLEENAKVKFAGLGGASGEDILKKVLIQDQAQKLQDFQGLSPQLAQQQAEDNVKQAFEGTNTEDQIRAKMLDAVERQNEAITALQDVLDVDDPLQTHLLRDMNNEFLGEMSKLFTDNLVAQEQLKVDAANQTITQANAAKSPFKIEDLNYALATKEAEKKNKTTREDFVEKRKKGLNMINAASSKFQGQNEFSFAPADPTGFSGMNAKAATELRRLASELQFTEDEINQLGTGSIDTNTSEAGFAKLQEIYNNRTASAFTDEVNRNEQYNRDSGIGNKIINPKLKKMSADEIRAQIELQSSAPDSRAVKEAEIQLKASEQRIQTLQSSQYIPPPLPAPPITYVPSAVDSAAMAQQAAVQPASWRDMYRPNGASSNYGQSVGYNNTQVAPQNASPVVTSMESAIADMSRFASKIESAALAMNGMSMTIEATHRVEVVLNGAETLAALIPEFQKMVTEESKVSINHMLDKKFPNAGHV